MGKFGRREVDGTGSGSLPMVGFGINGVETSDSVTINYS
jgi:hypothetical protein